MIFIQIAVFLICSGLFWWGGYKWHDARRFIMPILIAGMSFVLIHNWICLTQLSVIAIYCMGYGDKSPLRHIFGDGWGRGVWGVLAGLALSLGMFLTGHLNWYYFVPYLAVNFTLENALKKIPQNIGDPLIGAGFSCIIFLIK